MRCYGGKNCSTIYSISREKITLSLYDKAHNYVDYLDENNIAYPDVIMASDIDCCSATQHYKDLCKKVLNKKPNMKNVVLTKGEPVTLNSISFDANNMLIESRIKDGLNLSSKDYRLIDIPFGVSRNSLSHKIRYGFISKTDISKNIWV